MLSPGRWHEKVVKGPEHEAWRTWLLDRANRSKRVRDNLIAACREDLLFYINAFVYQHNPKNLNRERGPFVTWPFQDRAFRVILDCIYCECGEKDDGQAHGHDLVIKKSREMGASWMCLLACDWLARSLPYKDFLMISKTIEAVDSHSHASLFWKIDFVHKNLPEWLRPEITRRKMFYEYKETGGTIVGEASTGRAGVGGRFMAMFIDEFSQIREDYEVLHRTADTTSCRIFNFTYTGTGNAAYEISQRPDMRKLTMHWSEHPKKNRGLYVYNLQTGKVEHKDQSYHYRPDYTFVCDGTPLGGPYPGLRSPWYDQECVRRSNSRAVSMDLDIDAAGASKQMIDALTLRRLKSQWAISPLWEGDLVFDSDSGRPQELVKRTGGVLKLWINPTVDGKLPPDRYAIGIDLAAGTGASNTCLSAACAKTGEKILEYCDPNITPERLAPFAVALAWLLKDQNGTGALMAWECPGPGLLFGQKVIGMGYRNIWYRQEDAKFGGQRSDTPGWWSLNTEAKRLLLTNYVAALTLGEFVNRSEPALDECQHFCYQKDGSLAHSQEKVTEDPSGARANHGDRVIADALCCKMVAEIGRPHLNSKPVQEIPYGSLAWRRQLRENAEREEEEMEWA